MASYEKHTWTDDEVITKEKLNHIEDGITNIELTPGPAGPKGETGDPGAAGTNGLGWLFGTNIPNSEGRDGDLYLKTDNFDVYKKVSGSWQKIGNIKGAQGPKGADATINKLNKVDALDGAAEVAAVVTAFNNLIADLKAKGYMNEA
ncbi:hypothetical protein NE398_11910 [Clostridium tertium]|uniref:Collagen triple helix repeat (20 copies) n=1 Tax=Clostridium tertium TaxID=1559 RepID=A0A9X4B325_9CLOT|nr:hypothetical protein [Clostridium tertium]MDC4240863.1 hypothetical protein [Clostridium tertium]